MAETVALSKILNVREREKHDAQKDYHQSMEYFEGVATRLYTLLKKKENAEEVQEAYLETTISIDKIREQITYIENLNKQIVQLQRDVRTARTEMEAKQVKLTDAHVEVKKFEKIITYRKKEQQERIQKQEKIFMDELSVQQYLNQKNR
ncbi:flagellar export protein FliJ [Virgibacillus necropolis]|uniref:Flagellar FliJ protein n=1 Tax=Virgibacillus necropolis TaxID=163877 RepID=A0A221MDK2_9BACI|nr:flagellar export protein FliJ [Virgibacillus necropolis]ASN05725.1 flagellar export protein FliJ [Virgibacillus necropolis]